MEKRPAQEKEAISSSAEEGQSSTSSSDDEGPSPKKRRAIDASEMSQQSLPPTRAPEASAVAVFSSLSSLDQLRK
jgi:hypothetical protein